MPFEASYFKRETLRLTAALSTTVSASLGLKDFFPTVIKAFEVPMSKNDPAR